MTFRYATFEARKVRVNSAKHAPEMHLVQHCYPALLEALGDNKIANDVSVELSCIALAAIQSMRSAPDVDEERIKCQRDFSYDGDVFDAVSNAIAPWIEKQLFSKFLLTYDSKSRVTHASFEWFVACIGPSTRRAQIDILRQNLDALRAKQCTIGVQKIN